MRRFIAVLQLVVGLMCASALVPNGAAAGDYFVGPLRVVGTAVAYLKPAEGSKVVRSFSKGQLIIIGRCTSSFGPWFPSETQATNAALRKMLAGSWCDVLDDAKRTTGEPYGFVSGSDLEPLRHERATTSVRTARRESDSRRSRVLASIPKGTLVEIGYCRYAPGASTDSFGDWCFGWADPDRTDRKPVGGWFAGADLRKVSQ